jgi:arylsulfatase
LTRALATQWLQSFKEYPMRQKPASFNLDSVIAKLEKTGSSSN